MKQITTPLSGCSNLDDRSLYRLRVCFAFSWGPHDPARLIVIPVWYVSPFNQATRLHTPVMSWLG